MAAVTKVSIEEYLGRQSAEGFRDELIEGEIVLSPEPKPRHEDVCFNLVSQLAALLAGTEFIVRTRTNVVLRADDSMPSPDVFVIDRVRWQRARDSDVYPEGSPQLPIEVHSPANRPGLLRKKVELYLKNGAWAVWVVSLNTRTIVVHVNSDVVAEYRMGESVPLPGSLAALSLRVENIFRVD